MVIVYFILIDDVFSSQTIFRITPLNWDEWVAVLYFSFPVIILDEVLKLVSRTIGKKLLDCLALNVPCCLASVYRPAIFRVYVEGDDVKSSQVQKVVRVIRTQKHIVDFFMSCLAD